MDKAHAPGDYGKTREIFRRLPKRFSVSPLLPALPYVPRAGGPRSFKQSRYQKRYLSIHSTTSRAIIVDETGLIECLNQIAKKNDVSIEDKQKVQTKKKKKSLKRVRDKNDEAELSSDDSFGKNQDDTFFDDLNDESGDGTTIVPYIDTLPAGLRDRERELHVHHSEVPEAWGALFAAITEGSLPRVMRLWDRGVLRRSALLHKSAVCHPLLVAIHRFWPDLVAFFVAVGCNPTQKGSVHPYSGDLMSSELAQHENSPADLRRIMQDLQFSDSDCNGRKVEFVALRAMALFLGPDRRKARKAALKHMRWLRRKFEEGKVPPKQPWPPLDAKTNGEYARAASRLVAVRKKVCAINRAEIGYPGGELPRLNRSKQPYWEEEGGDLHKYSADPLETALVVPPRRPLIKDVESPKPLQEPNSTSTTSLTRLRVPDLDNAEKNDEAVGETLGSERAPVSSNAPENSVWAEDGLFYHPQEIPRALQPLIYQGIHLTRSKPADKDDISVTVRMLRAFLIGRPVCSDGEIETQGGQFIATQTAQTTADIHATTSDEPFSGVILGSKENLESIVSKLNLSSEIAKKQISLLLSQPGDSQNHPLLHAVHNQRPALVRLFLMIGMDPLQAGTVHPYSGDGLRTDEVSAISPFLLSQKMRTMSSLSSRQRRLVAADAVVAIEEHLSNLQNLEAIEATQPIITFPAEMNIEQTVDFAPITVPTEGDGQVVINIAPSAHSQSGHDNIAGYKSHSSRKLLQPKRAEFRALVWRERAGLLPVTILDRNESVSDGVDSDEVVEVIAPSKSKTRPLKKRKGKASDDGTDDDDDEDFEAPDVARENRGRRAKTIAMTVFGTDQGNDNDGDDDDDDNDDDEFRVRNVHRGPSVELRRSDARNEEYERYMQRKEAHARRLYCEDNASIGDDTSRQFTLDKSLRSVKETQKSARDVSVVGRWEGIANSKGNADTHPEFAIDLRDNDSDDASARSESDIDSDVDADVSVKEKPFMKAQKLVRFSPSVRRATETQNPLRKITSQTQSGSSLHQRLPVSSRERFAARFAVLTRSRFSSRPVQADDIRLPSRPPLLSFASKDAIRTTSSHGVVRVLQRYRDIIPDGYYAAPGPQGPSLLDSSSAPKHGSFFVRFSDLQRELAERDRLHREVIGLKKLQRLLESGAQRTLDKFINSLAKKALGRVDVHMETTSSVEGTTPLPDTQPVIEVALKDNDDIVMEPTPTLKNIEEVQLLDEDMKLGAALRNDIAIAATELDSKDRNSLIAARTILFPMSSSQLSFFPRPPPASWNTPDLVPPSEGGVRMYLLPPWIVGFRIHEAGHLLSSIDSSTSPETIALEQALGSVEFASNKALAVRAIFKNLVPHYVSVIERAEVRGNVVLSLLRKNRGGVMDDSEDRLKQEASLRDAEHEARISLTYLISSLKGIDRMVNRFVERIISSETSENSAETADDVSQAKSMLRLVLLSLLQALSIVILDDGSKTLDDEEEEEEEEEEEGEEINCVSDISRLSLSEFRVGTYRIRPLAVLPVLPVEPRVFIGDSKDSSSDESSIVSWTLESRSLLWTYALKWTKSIHAVNSGAITECTALRRTIVQQLVQIAVDFPSSLELPREKLSECNAVQIPSLKLWAPILYSWAEFFDSFPTAYDAWSNVLDNLQRGVSTYSGAFLDQNVLFTENVRVSESSVSSDDSVDSLVRLIEKKEIAAAIGWQLVLSLACPLSSFKSCARSSENANDLLGWECCLAREKSDNLPLRTMPQHIALVATSRPGAQSSVQDNPLSGTILHQLLSSAPSGSLESVNMNTAALLVRARRIGQQEVRRSPREISGMNRRRITKLLKRVHGGFRSVIRQDKNGSNSSSDTQPSVIQVRLHLLSLIRERAATIHAWFTSGGSQCAIPPAMSLRFSLSVLNLTADIAAISVPPSQQFIGEHPEISKAKNLPSASTPSQDLTISRDGSVVRQSHVSHNNKSVVDVGVPVAQTWSNSKNARSKMRLEPQEQSSIGSILCGNADDEVFYPALQLPSWLLASVSDGKAALSDLRRAAIAWSQWIDQSYTLTHRYEINDSGQSWDALQHSTCESVHACIGVLVLLSHSHILAKCSENIPSILFCAPQTGLPAVKSALKMRPLTGMVRNAIVRPCVFPPSVSEVVELAKVKRTFVCVPTSESKGSFAKRILPHASLHLRLCCGLFQALLAQLPASPEWQALPSDSSLPQEPNSFFSSLPSLPSGTVDISASDAAARGVLVEALWSMFRGLSVKAHTGKSVPMSALPLSKVFMTELLSIAAATAFDLKTLDLLQNPISSTPMIVSSSSSSLSVHHLDPPPTQVYTQMGFVGNALVKPSTRISAAICTPSAPILPDDPHGSEYSRALYSHTSAWNALDLSHSSSMMRSLRLQHMSVIQRIGDALFDVVLRESVAHSRSTTKGFWALVSTLESELVHYDSMGARILLKTRGGVFGDLLDLLTRSMSSANASSEGSRYADCISFSILSLIRAIAGAPFSAFRVNAGSVFTDLVQKVDLIEKSLKEKQAASDGTMADDDDGLGDILDALEGKKAAADNLIGLVRQERLMLFNSIKMASSALLTPTAQSQQTTYVSDCPDISSLISALESITFASMWRRFSSTNSGSTLVVDQEPLAREILYRRSSVCSYASDDHTTYLPYEEFSLYQPANVLGQGVVSVAAQSLTILGRIWALSAAERAGCGFDGFFSRYRPAGVPGTCDATDHGIFWKERDVAKWPIDSFRNLQKRVWPLLLSSFLQYFSNDPLHGVRTKDQIMGRNWDLISETSDALCRSFWLNPMKTWRAATSGRNGRAVISAFACCISAQTGEDSEARKISALAVRDNLEQALTWLWARDSIAHAGSGANNVSTAMFRSFGDIWGFLQKGGDRRLSGHCLPEDAQRALREMSRAIENYKTNSGFTEASKTTPSWIFFSKTVDAIESSLTC